MIPVRHASLRLVGRPYLRRVRDRARPYIRNAGTVRRYVARERFVTLQCDCGNRTECELSKWKRRPPSKCLECHHESMRRRGAA